MSVSFEKQRKEFMRNAAQSNSNVYLGIVKKDEVLSLGSHPCHGGYKKNFVNYAPNALVWSPMLQKNLMKEDDVKVFVNWLTQESVWAPLYLSKSWEEVKSYGFLVRTDMSENYTISGCIASRLSFESYCDFSPLRENWNSLREIGMNLEDAFIFAHLFSKSKKGWVVAAFKTGHTVFDLQFTQEVGFRNYFHKTPENMNPTTFAENRGYGPYGNGYGVHSLFSPQQAAKTSFYDQIMKMLPTSAKKSTNYNIFAKKPSQGYLLQNAADVMSIVAQIKEACDA